MITDLTFCSSINETNKGNQNTLSINLYNMTHTVTNDTGWRILRGVSTNPSFLKNNKQLYTLRVSAFACPRVCLCESWHTSCLDDGVHWQSVNCSLEGRSLCFCHSKLCNLTALVFLGTSVDDGSANQNCFCTRTYTQALYPKLQNVRKPDCAYLNGMETLYKM